MNNWKWEKPESPKLESIEQASSGWVNKYVLHYELPDGRKFEYEAASRKGLDEFKAELEAHAAGEKTTPDAVCIVPILPDDSLLMIREFRYPLNAWCIAFPAGLIDEGEDIVSCVERELHEEVGCKLSPVFGKDAVVALPQSGYSSTGLTDENVQVVFARVVTDGVAEPEPNELIYPFKLKIEEIDAFLRENDLLIGTRAQLILETFKRSWKFARKQPAPVDPITKYDFA